MYPIQATVTLNSAAQLQAFTAFIMGGQGAEVSAVSITAAEVRAERDATGATMQEAKEAVREKKLAATTASSPPAEKEAAAPAKSSESTSASSNASETSAPAAEGRTIDDAKALTTKLVNEKGRAVAVELLAKYNAPVAAKLAPEHVGPFCADAEAALAA